LVPIALDKQLPPLGFRQVQSINFGRWPRDTAALEALTSTLDRRLERDHETIPASAKPPYKRRIAGVAVAVLAIVASALFAWYLLKDEAVADDGVTTIAVLPYSNSAGDQYDGQRQSYAAAIVDGLAYLPDIEIVSARTSFAAAADNLDTIALAERLGANYLVEGDIQLDGNALRVTSRLIDGGTGRPVWTDSRSIQSLRLPELQQQSIRYIAAALQGYLGIGLGHLPADSSLSGQALDQYRRGMTLLLTRSNAKESIDSYNAFKRTVELAPNVADAHAGLAYALTDIGPFTLSMEPDAFRAANEAAYERALELDPDSMFGLIAKAETIHKEYGDVAQALALFEQVLEQDPDFGPAHELLAELYATAGDHRASLEAASRALTLAPFDNSLVGIRAGALRALDRYANIRNEALSCRVNCEASGLSWMSALAAIGPRSTFDRELDRLAPFAREGGLEEDTVQQLVDYVTAVVKREDIGDNGELFGSFYTSVYHMRVSDDEVALDWLERYLDRAHAGMLTGFLNDDRFTPPPSMRAHPRYHAIFERPKYKAVADYRRRQGILTGLPIAPEEVAAEEARIRAEDWY
ncbi:MAG: tetratricopeptide repeat protein, partial [Sphingomonadaceae bacterium]